MGFLRASSLVAVLALCGCEAILGIGDPSLNPGASQPTGGSSGGGGTAATGGTGATGGGEGGMGGATAPDFTFSILAPPVEVPYDGQAYVAVEIVRLNGFDGAVDVEVVDPPAALGATPTTIAAGESTGELLLGATLGLTEGTSFDLEMVATSAAIAHSATVPAIVTGTPGTIDEGFGTVGLTVWVMGEDGGTTAGVREVAGGKLLLAGSSTNSLGSVQPTGARLLADGAFDETFNGDGRYQTAYCGCFAPAPFRGTARSSDGKLHFIGGAAEANNDPRDVAYLRMLDDGSEDEAVGSGGKVLLEVGAADDDAYAVEIDAADRAVIAGVSDGQAFVARITTAGILDPAYGTAGKTVMDLTYTSKGNALAIDADGNALVAGLVNVDATWDDALVLRFDDTGALDRTFAGDGIAQIELPGDQELFFVGVDPAGRILVAGQTTVAGDSDLFAARFLPDGTLDPSYGSAGVRVILEPGDQTAVDAAMFADGRLAIAANDGIGPILGRLRPNGDVDPTYGDNALVPVFLGPEDVAMSVTVTADGGTILTGIRDSYPYNAVVTRIWN